MAALIPKSKAKTAYGLLSEIAALVTAEPKRFDMSTWIRREKHGENARRGFPACGTVGCIGGWTQLLRPREGGAQTILGLTFEQSNELFTPSGWLAEDGQTAAHARKYVAHLRRFQKKYAAQLKAKKLGSL